MCGLLSDILHPFNYLYRTTARYKTHWDHHQRRDNPGDNPKLDAAYQYEDFHGRKHTRKFVPHEIRDVENQWRGERAARDGGDVLVVDNVTPSKDAQKKRLLVSLVALFVTAFGIIGIGCTVVLSKLIAFSYIYLFL